MPRKRGAAQAVLAALCLASCGTPSLSERAVGQYDFVRANFSITGASADTSLVAGQGKTFGNLILHPGGKLTSAGSLSGMDAYMTGTWSVDGDELRLVIDSVGGFPGSDAPILARLDGRSLTFSFTTTPPTVRWTYVIAMRTDLNKLAAAEQKYFADSGRYTPDLVALGLRPSAGVHPPTIQISARSYSATVTHSRLPNASCAISRGMKNPVDSTGREGAVLCALPPERDSLIIEYTWRRAS